MLPVKNVYIYVKKDDINKCIKYGMKLSEYSNISFKDNVQLRKGILAYFSPKDSYKYSNDSYDILRIDIRDLTIYVHNNTLVLNENNLNFRNMCNLRNYELGEFINPELVICSSILPENIFRYNRIIDVPLLIDTSREYYLQKEEEKLVQESFNNLTYTSLLG